MAIKKEGNAAMYLKSQQGRFVLLLVIRNICRLRSICSLNEYCFDAAFDSSSTQREVYDKTTKPFIPNVIDGYNVTVFAYGATGQSTL